MDISWWPGDRKACQDAGGQAAKCPEHLAAPLLQREGSAALKGMLEAHNKEKQCI